jgi:hypothetical protein
VTALLLANLLHGEITYYAPGVMQQVYSNRLVWRHVAPCARCVGMIALADARQLGRHAYITRPGLPTEGPYLVTDAGTFRTPGRIAEVDHGTAHRWGMRGPVQDVTVFVMDGKGD